MQNAAGVDSINIMAAAPPDVPPELTVSPIAMQFTDDQPQAVSISNTGGGGALSWTAQKSAAWIVLSSSSGVTPSSVNVSVDTAQNPGTYSGTVTISASGVTQAIAITLTILPPKTNGTTITSVVNAASLLPGPIAPGEIILITGTNLKRPVSISGVPATVLYDSPTQIVAIAPSQFALTINTIAISSVSVPIQSARANPGIFNLAGQAIAKTADGTWNSSLQPAAVGTNVTIFITGAGGFTDAVSAIVGGVSAMVVAAGPAPAPYASGVGQIKLRVPVVLTSGSVPVQVQIGTAMSPGTPSIFVQ